MLMKNSNRYIYYRIIIIVVSITLVSILGTYKYLEKRTESDVLPSGLSLKESMYYLQFYKFFSHPYINRRVSEIIEEDYNVIRDGVDIYPSMITVTFLPVFNYVIFDEEGMYYERLEKARNKLKEYGFNNEKYMTVQWVLDNPIEAYEIFWLSDVDIFPSDPAKYIEIFIQNNEEQKNGLTTFENIIYAWAYKLESDIPLFYIDSKTEYIDGTQEIEFSLTEETERFIGITNFMFWEYEADTEHEFLSLRSYRKIFEAYGFSKQNYITTQWVIENPIKAYKMIDQANYDFFWDTPKFQKAYEEYLEELAIIKE
ncbi:hypothetical protein EDC19_1693 [Natranaerovirga hydrolytica]|uniref:Uncharacterized protein n=1 Tax=Natranaerovirga hydrolytica TaxID=680378 RepID=A0A4R1MPW4_9FIRM|nr:hypothetical protein [Natranaerovirga hydrolytica]TCK92549.1 hypothetical protein EDC19_1693 [Natranaerovirga hydrolytica]